MHIRTALLHREDPPGGLFYSTILAQVHLLVTPDPSGTGSCFIPTVILIYHPASFGLLSVSPTRR